MKTLFNKIKSLFPRRHEQKDAIGENYMDSEEFREALFKAAEEGAKDQGRYMKSIGASWD